MTNVNPQPHHKFGCPIFAAVSSRLRWASRNARPHLLPAALLILLALTASFTLAQTTPPAKLAFDVATIKASHTTDGGMGLGKSSPDGISLIHCTAKSLIANAYGIKADLIAGGPPWSGASEYDIDAKILPTDGAPSPHLTRSQIQTMLQALLADRFQLAVHTETKQLPVYELTIARGGPKLHAATPGDTYPNGIKGPDGRSGSGMMMIMDGKFTGQAIPISGLADTLSLILHRTVIDKTGLTGKYDITLPLPRDSTAPPPPASADESPASSPPPDASPSFFTLLEDQLGLKLVSTKGPVETLVIDHVEHPTEN